MILLAIYFVLLVAALIFNAVLKDRREFRRFTRLRSSSKRRRTMRKWLVQSFVFFGAASVVTLVLAREFVPAFMAEVRGIRFISDARLFFVDHAWVTVLIVVVFVGGGVLGIIAARRETEIPSIGDVQSLLPRNRAELKWGALLSINAGLVEELLFRLAMPALVFGFTGNAVVAAVVSVVVFGALHAYQGWPGMIGATIIGCVFMALFVLTGTIVVPIIVHALFDLRSLVLIPIVIKGVHRISAVD